VARWWRSLSVEEARQVFLARRLVERAITELAVHATPSKSPIAPDGERDSPVAIAVPASASRANST